MLLNLTLIIIVLIQFTEQDLTSQNDTSMETTKATVQLSIKDKMKKYIKAALSKNKTMKTGNMTNNNNNTVSSKSISPPPNKLLQEYLRCRQLSSINLLPTNYSCPYDFDGDNRVCWRATLNGSYGFSTIEYDHSLNPFYDNAPHGIENCTVQRLCQTNGTWAVPVPSDIQCRACIGDVRPVKFNSISIMIETMSLSLSLISLTIAILCMINVKRLHLPRNLLHMHLFLAFILRSIVKLIFIHLIIGGYTSTMITYARDKCGNVEILSKSSNLFHVIGCRILASLFWYTDAVSQTFIFCEAMFLFTALTSHLFRDRGCTLFVLWGWLSPLVWLTMWIVSHIITDKLKFRSTCWLEGDNTTYFYYYFYVPYAFYLLVNFGIFLYLVRLLYSKYRSNYVPAARTGNRHLIKSIIILIPLFGLHSLFVVWVFYHKNQGHTIWYYIAVIFKAVFGDLQGFFTSLIYFYFNTEIRSEVLRQVQRTLSSNDAVRRNSAGETLSTRLSVFRISLNRRRRSSHQNRSDRGRTAEIYSTPSTSNTHKKCCRTILTFICPCLNNKKTTTTTTNKNNSRKILEQANQPKKRLSIEPMVQQNELSPTIQTNPLTNDDINRILLTLPKENRPSKGKIDTSNLAHNSILTKNETDNDDLLTDENDVTFHQTSFSGEQTPPLSNSRLSIKHNVNNNRHIRSKSDGHDTKILKSKLSDDNKSLR